MTKTDQLLRRGWRIGAEDFCDWLADRLARRGHVDERASERRDKREKPFDSLTLAQDHSTRAGFMFGTLITSRIAARSVVMSEA